MGLSPFDFEETAKPYKWAQQEICAFTDPGVNAWASGKKKGQTAFDVIGARNEITIDQSEILENARSIMTSIAIIDYGVGNLLLAFSKISDWSIVISFLAPITS